MNKLARIISGMGYDELTAIEHDLYEGNMGRLIKKRKKDLEAFMSPEKVCPTCGSPVTERDSPYTLIFGPPGFRKKASFCGRDCLTFFIDKLDPSKKEINN